MLETDCLRVTSSARRGGCRTHAGVPMLREGNAIGRIVVTGVRPVQPFTDKQIELLKTFADQAVIAIENTRLFEEVQARNARAGRGARSSRPRPREVLQVISSSPGESEARAGDHCRRTPCALCGARFGTLYLLRWTTGSAQPMRQCAAGIRAGALRQLARWHLQIAGSSECDRKAAAQCRYRSRTSLSSRVNHCVDAVETAGFRAVLSSCRCSGRMSLIGASRSIARRCERVHPQGRSSSCRPSPTRP